MAKTNNLNEFLTGIADQIRANDGTSDKINPQDFEDKIKNTVGEDVARITKKSYGVSTTNQTIAAGQYIDSDITIKAVKISGIDGSKILDTATILVGDEDAEDSICEVDGRIGTNTADSVTVSGKTVSIPAGYYGEKVEKSVQEGSVTVSASATQSGVTYSIDELSGDYYVFMNVPAKTVSNAAVATVSEGYVASEAVTGDITLKAGSAEALYLNTLAATTIYPSNAATTVVAKDTSYPYYATGDIKVAAVTGLINQAMSGVTMPISITAGSGSSDSVAYFGWHSGDEMTSGAVALGNTSQVYITNVGTVTNGYKKIIAFTNGSAFTCKINSTTTITARAFFATYDNGRAVILYSAD